MSGWEPVEGDLVRIVGERGVFRVKKQRHDGDLDLFGGPANRVQWRTVAPDRVRRASPAERRAAVAS